MASDQLTFLSLFSGIGGLSLGFERAGFRCIGAYDFDKSACADHGYLTGTPATQCDLAYMDAETLRLRHPSSPHVVVSSPPCKGFSGCLPEAMARTERYQRMNTLVMVTMRAVLDAWPTAPPPLIVIENVPRIQSRGRQFLDALEELLNERGYAVDRSTHCCGELGGLGQRRRRFLLVARHRRQVPEYLYHPPRNPLRGCGEVIESLPLPDHTDQVRGPMHRLNRLSDLNWARLALIPAGGDWRDLPEGVLHLGDSSPYHGCFGVMDPRSAAGTVRARTSVRNSATAIADPRLPDRASRHSGRFGVESGRAPCHTVTGANTRVGCGWASAVVDPRLAELPGRYNGKFGVEQWSTECHTIAGRNARVGVGWASAIADPRLETARREGQLGLAAWDAAANTVIARTRIQTGRWSVADPRVDTQRREGSVGVTGWRSPSTTVIGAPSVHNGPWQVADPRLHHTPREGSHGVDHAGDVLPTITGSTRVGHNRASAIADTRYAVPTHYVLESGDTPVIVGPTLDLRRDCRRSTYRVIVAADGTWHRPLTTYELLVLQGFPQHVDGMPTVLEGGSHERWRQRIGNAVPPPAAEAIAVEMRRTLEASRNSQLLLSSGSVWVRPGVDLGAPLQLSHS